MMQNTIKKLELPIIYDINKFQLMLPFHEKGHLVIAGDSLTLVSYSLNYILRMGMHYYNPNELKYLIYSKSITKETYVQLENYLRKPIVHTEIDLLELLRWVKKTLSIRYRMFRTYHSRDIYAFNLKVKNKDINKRLLSPLMIIIDDMPKLDDPNNHPISKLIIEIAQQSRAAGIHVILSTTNVQASLGNYHKYIMPYGIASKLDSDDDSRFLTGFENRDKLNINEVAYYEFGKYYEAFKILDEKTENSSRSIISQ